MPPSLDEEEEDQGDTIVVKGEYNWSRPSSPESMSPEIGPLVANLLAQIDTPQHLESPEPLEDTTNQNLGELNSRDNQPTQRTPKQSQRTGVSTMEERLLMMPEKRSLPWRPGVEPGAEIETGGDSRRKQIRFGCLLATRGDVAPVPCNSCANGRGKFSVCVILEGYFKGACASCQLSGRPNRCSIKKNDDVIESPTFETPGGIDGDISFNSGQHESSVEMPQAKRTRKNNSIPEWENSRPQWEQQLGDSQARQPMNEIIPARQPMNEIVPTPGVQRAMNEIVPAPGIRTPMNEIVPVQRAWASVNAPSPAQTTPVQTMNNDSNGVRSIPRNSTGRTNSVKWAAVNQPSPLPPPSQLPVHNNNGVGGNESGNRSNQDQDQGRREDTVVNEEGSVALIDTFPKSKQRQVYGLVSGLQGGIENLQRELDTLKRALGIDDED